MKAAKFSLGIAGLLFLAACASNADSTSAPNENLVFVDLFERNESQEIKDEIGNGWTVNSDRHAKGAKQVDLKDGAMYFWTEKGAGHNVSVVHEAPFKDGRVELKFLLNNSKAYMKVNFASNDYKASHAGHLIDVRVSAKQVEMSDLIFGKFSHEIRDARLADKLTTEQKERVKQATKKVKHDIDPAQWHDLMIDIQGDTMIVFIDGAEVSRLTKPGIASPSKDKLRFATALAGPVAIDDLRVYAKQ